MLTSPYRRDGREPVAEITDGRNYDVTAADGEVVGEDVPAWIARVIVACLDRPPLVTVPVPGRPAPGRHPEGRRRAS
jgi:hypothetical protein